MKVPRQDDRPRCQQRQPLLGVAGRRLRVHGHCHVRFPRSMVVALAASVNVGLALKVPVHRSASDECGLLPREPAGVCFELGDERCDGVEELFMEPVAGVLHSVEGGVGDLRVAVQVVSEVGGSDSSHELPVRCLWGATLHRRRRVPRWARTSMSMVSNRSEYTSSSHRSEGMFTARCTGRGRGSR